MLMARPGHCGTASQRGCVGEGIGLEEVVLMEPEAFRITVQMRRT